MLEYPLINEVEYEMSIAFLNSFSVKKSTTRGQSAGVREKSTLSPASLKALQRLHAGDLIFSYLVGFVEGDGFFTITKNGKYIKWEFGIELNIKDVQLIYKIKTLLGVGSVAFRVRPNNSEMVRFRIRDKETLSSLIFPIFDKYPMFTNKLYDYLRFKELLLSDIILYEELPVYTRPTIPLNNIESILQRPYFYSWLIGFIEAEGCFSIYKPLNETSFIGSFDISQTNEYIIIAAISQFFNFTNTVYHHKETNNYKVKVSSVRQIENTIKIMQRGPVKLLGYKRLQYLLWLKELRKIPRYSNKIKIPNQY
jgi:hypothetical protein